MEFTREQIALAKSDQNDIWAFGNEVLYRLCQEHPMHQRLNVVVAKIWLIGRSYAAAVERRKNKDGEVLSPNDTFYEREVAPALKVSELDERITALRQFSTIEDTSIVPILELHKHLVTVLEVLTHENKRSLASKYLHFHLPYLFYIYDSRAEQMLARIKPRRKARRSAQGDFDECYKIFFLKLLDVRDEIYQDSGEVLTPRQIDRLLLSAPVAGNF